MTIQLYKQPNALNFSKNPIPFGFNISPFSDTNVIARQRIYVAVLFSFEMDNPQYEELWTGAIGPDKDGFALVDVAAILDAKLKFYTPNTNLLKFHKCKEQCGIFKVRYYLGDNNSILTAEYNTDPYYVYKGGVAKEDFDNAATYLNTTLYDNGTPMHFYEVNEYVRPTEPKWLYFIYKTASAVANELTVYIDYLQADGFGSQYNALTQTFIPVPYQVYCVPVDPVSLLLPDNCASYPNLLKYSLIIQDQSPEDICATTFWLDWRPFYEEQHILYRNSLGGLETQAILGEKEFGTLIDGDATETITVADMMGDTLIQREQRDSMNLINSAVKGNTGWITKHALLRLKDLLLNKGAWVPYGRRLKPVYVTTRNTMLHRSSDKLYSLPIDYANAYNDENWNPELSVEFTDVCPAVEFLYGGCKQGGYIWVQWKLPPGYDRIEFYFTVDITGATITEITFNGNMGIANIPIPTATPMAIVDFEVTLKARCVCNDEVSPFSYGAYTADIVINGSNYIAPIANDDMADLGPRSPATRFLLIAGAPLNVLSNDIATNGGVLEAVSLYDNTGAVPGFTSENGAVAIMSATGYIAYTPTPASMLILTEDLLYYKMKETVSPYGDLTSNLATIRVPLDAQIPKVYVKLSRLNDSEVLHKFGLGNVFKMHDYITDYYLQFFKDAACTIAIDVTTYGIVIGFDIQLQTRTYNSIGQLTSITGYAFESTDLVSAIGTSMLFKLNFYLSTFFETIGCYVEDRKIISNQGTSTGNIVFVGW